ncbi:zinc ribbon domain-containing protein, partial [Frankia sp. AgKG'84/4]|nr:zinc ribbon domain-containing protein [Frankia sp. AgKG'84/4]
PVPLPTPGSGPLVMPGSGPLPLGGLGVEGDEVALDAITGPVRLVAASRVGQAVESAPVGEAVYTPVTVHGSTAVVGRALRHVVIEPVRDLRADDRGESIILSFQMPPGVSEARVFWRRDRPPTGPDDPLAASARVTNASLEIKGGWHLAAPADGWAYHVSAYPVYRVGEVARIAAVGVSVLARAATRADPPPVGVPSAVSPGTGAHVIGRAAMVAAGARLVAGPMGGQDSITAPHPLGGPAHPPSGSYPLPVPVGATRSGPDATLARAGRAGPTPATNPLARRNSAPTPLVAPVGHPAEGPVVPAGPPAGPPTGGRPFGAGRAPDRGPGDGAGAFPADADATAAVTGPLAAGADSRGATDGGGPGR